MPHRLSGYDKRTRLLAHAFGIPPEHDDKARATARIPDSAPDAIGRYPLSSNATAAVAALVCVPCDPALYDYVCEPVAAAAPAAYA